MVFLHAPGVTESDSKKALEEFSAHLQIECYVIDWR
jgi:hypothetical protein